MIRDNFEIGHVTYKMKVAVGDHPSLSDTHFHRFFFLFSFLFFYFFKKKFYAMKHIGDYFISSTIGHGSSGINRNFNVI